MERVTGIGGIFFEADDPRTLQAWYARHLGIDVQSWGGAVFRWDRAEAGTTTWSIGSRGGNESAGPFVVNYRVADLDGLLQALRDEGCAVLDEVSESEFGKFGWVRDPEGNKVELWEPPPGR